MWKNERLILLIVIFCAASSYAQNKSNSMRKPVFSSVYSDIARGKSCRTIKPELIGCTPVGGYRIFAGFHNVLERIWIETASGVVKITDLPSHKQPGISRSAGKIEWRLANGKPFAVIARFEFFFDGRCRSRQGYIYGQKQIRANSDYQRIARLPTY